MSEQDTQQQRRAVGSANGGPAAGAAQVVELETRVRELEDAWRRALADAENLRKRIEREVARVRAEERAHVAAAWLPILDNLDLALEHAAADPQSIVAGVRAVRDQALGIVGALGFPRRDDTGAAFDPVWHEAVAVRPAAGAAPGTVVAVVRPGYGQEDRRLRPAAVVVAAAEPAAADIGGNTGNSRDPAEIGEDTGRDTGQDTGAAEEASGAARGGDHGRA